MAGIANLIGTSEETYKDAKAELAKEFEPLKSGVYSGQVKSIKVYVNNFGSNSMRYTITVKDEDGEKRDVEFINDINSKLKGDVDNLGYSARFKSVLYATGTDESDLSKKDKVGKLNSFGKEYDFDEILGMNGKLVKVEVMLRNDTNKAEGASFKYSNAIAGILAPDGTDASSEDKAEAFRKKIETKPVFDYEGYMKKSATAAQSATSAADLAESDF